MSVPFKHMENATDIHIVLIFLSVQDTLLKYFSSLLGSKVKAIKELCVTPTPTAPPG